MKLDMKRFHLNSIFNFNTRKLGKMCGHKNNQHHLGFFKDICFFIACSRSSFKNKKTDMSIQ